MKFKILSIVLLAAWPRVVHGSPPKAPPAENVRHLPASTKTQIGAPPVEMFCYDAYGQRELLKLDSRIESLIRMNEILTDQSATLERTIGMLQEELRLKSGTLLVMEGESRRLYEEWKAENKRRMELEVQPRQGVSKTLWIVTGLSVAASLVMGGYLFASR